MLAAVNVYVFDLISVSVQRSQEGLILCSYRSIRYSVEIDISYKRIMLAHSVLNTIDKPELSCIAYKIRICSRAATSAERRYISNTEGNRIRGAIQSSFCSTVGGYD